MDTTYKKLKKGDSFMGGIVGFDAETGKPLEDGQSTYVNTISSENLNNSTPALKLPETVPDTSASSFIAKAQAQNQSAIEKNSAVSEKKASQDEVANLMTQAGLVEGKLGQYQNDYEKAYGVNKEEIEAIQDEIDAESIALRAEIESLHKNPNLTTGLVSRLSSEANRKSASFIADRLVTQQILSRKFDKAKEAAKDAVAIELAPIKAELDAKKWVFENNVDSWNAQEKAQLDSIIKKEERVYQEEKKTKETLADNKVDLLKSASQQQAPLAIQKAIQNAQTIDELYEIPEISKYLTSPEEKLDLQLKRLQIQKATNDLTQSSEMDKLLSVDEAQKLGVPYGTTKGQAANGTGGGDVAKKNQILALQDKVGKVDALLANKGGLHAVVGPNELARTGFGNFNAFTGVEGDFVAGVKQITQQETLDTLINLKKAGGTLGALSDSEAQLLREAASKINTWEIKDEKGNGIGKYKTTEESFIKELQSIKTLTQRAIEEAGGVPPATPDIESSFFNAVDGALLNTGGTYQNAGYDIDL